MIDIPLALRVPPQGRYNRGIYTCYECGFEPPFCGCNFMRSTSVVRTSLLIRRSRFRSNGFPARNT